MKINLKFSGNWRDYLDRKNCLYIYTNLINNTKYVGVASELKDRVYKYKNEIKKYSDKSRVIIKAIVKYKEENFSLDFIEECSSYQEALNKEIEMILKLKNENIRLYNCTDGGEGFKGITANAGTKVYNSSFKDNDNFYTIFDYYHNRKMSCADVGKLFNVSQSVINHILSGKTYKKETVNLINIFPKLRLANEINYQKTSGECHASSKLKKEDIEKIFIMYHDKNISSREISCILNIDASTIQRILKGKAYIKTSIPLTKKYPPIRSCTEHIDYKLNSGELNNKAKLKEYQVNEILFGFFINKNTLTFLSKKYLVSICCISCITKGKCWKNLYNHFISKYEIQIST